jgi:putative membrane protein
MTKRRPTAFALDDIRVASPEDAGPDLLGRTQVVVAEQPDLFAEEQAALPVAAPAPRRWLRVLTGAVAGLVALALGLSVDSLIRSLFARNDWLGWFAVGLAGLAVLALLALAVREIAGLLRVRRINLIHAAAAEAAAADDRKKALGVIGDVQSLYRGRPETARGRNALASHASEIIDGRDLVALAETELLLPLDEIARRMVLSSAKRVAVVTAVSPRAVVDLVFVGAEILRLIRRLAVLYGGRPGTLGFLRLARAAITHLAVTGGMAAGDSIVQQFVGHGIAARLSAKLGEGVVNGMLTARVGIAAIEVCRPLPFLNGRPPRLSDVMSELTRISAKS